MSMSSKIKKSITLAGILAASAATAQVRQPTTPDEALDQLTGPNQPRRGRQNALCLSVTPYFLTSWAPSGSTAGHFVSLQIDGATQGSADQGNCEVPNPRTGLCNRGFIKVTTTAPVNCSVPIGL